MPIPYMGSKTKSFIESIFNILVGFTVAYISNMIVLPLFGYAVSTEKSLGIALVFTIISLVRSYIIRRLFVNGFYEFIKKLWEKN